MTSERETAVEMLERLEMEIKKINSGFPKDEYGEPDYFAHRMFHKNRNMEVEENKRTKSEVITNVWTWAVIGLITLFASAFIQNFPKILEILAK